MAAATNASSSSYNELFALLGSSKAAGSSGVSAVGNVGGPSMVPGGMQPVSLGMPRGIEAELLAAQEAAKNAKVLNETPQPGQRPRALGMALSAERRATRRPVSAPMASAHRQMGELSGSNISRVNIPLSDRKAVEGMRQRGPVNVQGGGKQKPSAEKNQVLHFCSYCMKVLGKLLEGKPDGPVLEGKLRALVNQCWGLWLGGQLSKQELVNRLGHFIRSSCPEAAKISISRGFQLWYQARIAHARGAQAVKQSSGQEQQQRLPANTLGPRNQVQERQREQHSEVQQRYEQRAGIQPSERSKTKDKKGRATPPKKAPVSVPEADEADDDKLLVERGAFRVKPPPARLKAPPARSNASVNAKLAGSKHSLAAASIQPSPLKKARGPKTTSRSSKKPKLPAPVLKNIPKPPAAGQAIVGAPPQRPISNKPRRVDEELNIVHNIVDIEGEEEALVADDSHPAQVVASSDSANHDKVVLLNGQTLRRKVEAVSRKHGLEGVLLEAVELISFAARERLSNVIEGLKETALTRMDARRREWRTRTTGADVREMLGKMRKDEQRALRVEKELRVEKSERAKKAETPCTEQAGDEKQRKEIFSADGAGGVAGAAGGGRKEKEEEEKKRQDVIRRGTALRQSTAGFRRKWKRAKAAAAMAPGEDWWMTDSLKASMTSGESGGSSVKVPVLPATRERVYASQTSFPASGIEEITRKDDVTGAPVKGHITLHDCLFFMQREYNLRRSPVLLKWSVRLGRRNSMHNAVES